MITATATALVVSVFCAGNWTVLENTDFNGYNLAGAPAKVSSSAEGCADICQSLTNCVAISWNGPKSRYHNLNCNFKCNGAHPSQDQGESAVVVRKDTATCSLPPPAPTPVPLPPCPTDWIDKWNAGQLLLAPYDDNTAQIGNGYVSTMAQVHVHGFVHGPCARAVCVCVCVCMCVCVCVCVCMCVTDTKCPCNNHTLYLNK
jgi:hypothetical protein